MATFYIQKQMYKWGIEWQWSSGNSVIASYLITTWTKFIHVLIIEV